MKRTGSRNRAARSFAVNTGAVTAALAMAPATFAQTPPAQEPSEIVITGSRIRGVEATGSNVIALDRDVIIETGAPSAGDLIRRLPQVVGLGASETASGAQNGAANVTRGVSVNLRGIGSNATLLLFGGRRMPPAGTQGQFTDASVIPTIAIERLEVVADGGSAIYGSDAVTGVVNLVPRRNFEGAETTARYGVADGYSDWSAAQIAGFSWDSGHVTGAVEYTSHSALRGRDRDFYTSDLRSRGGSDFRSQQCSPGTILVGGVPYAIPANSNGDLSGATLTPNTRNLCDNLKRGDIIPDLERLSGFVSLEQRLGDRVTLFGEGFFSQRSFTLRESQVTSNVNVTSANPFYFNPTGGTDPVTVQYDFANDGGLPENPGDATSWQATLGARFELGGDWRAEVYGSHGRSDDEVRRRQNLNTTPQGINAALANPDPAQAFNPFGGGGVSNAATVAAIRNGLFVIQGDTDLTVFGVQADGPLFSLGGHDVRLAVGAEYRDEGLANTLTSGSTAAPVRTAGDISRDVTAVFAEAYVPLVRQDGGHEVDLSLASRYEEYSDFGSTFNPKVGLSWRPNSSVSLRGSWGTSFRAPGLAENDPRSGGFGLYGDTLPCDHLPPATTCFGIGLAGGNPDVKAEEATTWSVGIELTPEALPNFRASATYFSIDYENQILALRGSAGLLTNPIYSRYRTLNPTPEQVEALLNSGLPINTPINAALVTYIQDGRRQNLGQTMAEGVDFGLSNAWTVGGGQVTAGLNASYFTKLETAAAPGAPQVDVLNTINFPQRFRARGDLGWRGEAFSALAFINYVNGYDQTGVTPIRKIDSFTTVDLHFGYDASALVSGLSLSLDVQNALDKDPPFVNIAGGYDPQSASPLGRLVALSLRKSW
jgi:iron complex outermembrane receptor protein